MIASWEMTWVPRETARVDERCDTCARGVIGRFGGVPHVCESCEADAERLQRALESDAERRGLA